MVLMNLSMAFSPIAEHHCGIWTKHLSPNPSRATAFLEYIHDTELGGFSYINMEYFDVAICAMLYSEHVLHVSTKLTLPFQDRIAHKISWKISSRRSICAVFVTLSLSNFAKGYYTPLSLRMRSIDLLLRISILVHYPDHRICEHCTLMHYYGSHREHRNACSEHSQRLADHTINFLPS